MNLLVTGGAGYVGSHMVSFLLEHGHQVTVIDDLSSGRRAAIRGGAFIQGDIGDRALLDRIFSASHFDGVLHFAASVHAGESINTPGKYYENNVVKSLRMLEAMHEHGVNNLVFSSSAAIYGEPLYVPIREDHPKSPSHAFGASKWMIETVLEHYFKAYRMASIALRYFNAAGAGPDAMPGTDEDRLETHLLAQALQAASGRRAGIEIAGRDYPTPDGTGIRDYVHVVDLCEAHLLAMQKLSDASCRTAYNLGSAHGYSALEILNAVRRVTRRNFDMIDRPRKSGEPARLLVDSSRAHAELGWLPRHVDLDTIVRHAWNREQRQARAMKMRRPLALRLT